MFPSLFEGLPIVLIEAQAAGLPCVVSNRVTSEVDMGGCMYLDIGDNTSGWTRMVLDLIDGNIQKQIIPEKLWQYDVRFMLNQLEGLYEKY